MFIYTVLALVAQPGLNPYAVTALVAPVFTFLALIAGATVVALAGGRDRSRRARLILGDLLAVLHPRRRGGRR
ncbi:hypothetical protein ABZ413_33575 [Nocardia rhamnosiphila]|uniref:hypothetical protein n=1 Tax=Nocardia rhamnosiphila TaxID=426716 RepID=UPI0033BFBAC4